MDRTAQHLGHVLGHLKAAAESLRLAEHLAGGADSFRDELERLKTTVEIARDGVKAGKTVIEKIEREVDLERKRAEEVQIPTRTSV